MIPLKNSPIQRERGSKVVVSQDRGKGRVRSWCLMGAGFSFEDEMGSVGGW